MLSMPVVRHSTPLGQIEHSSVSVRPLPLLKVPTGQFSPAFEPAIQNCPDGHLSPIVAVASISISLIGRGLQLPRRQ